MEDQHVYTHYVNDGPRINVKVERNSRGVNWEVTVTGAANVEDALKIIRDADGKLAAQYAPAPVVVLEKVAEPEKPKTEKGKKIEIAVETVNGSDPDPAPIWKGE